MSIPIEKLEAEAYRLGFSFFGISKPIQTPHFSKFINWIDDVSLHDLNYLRKNYILNARRNPTILLPKAESVITLGIAYAKPESIFSHGSLGLREYGYLAAYACLPDYHKLMKKRLKELIAYIDNFQDLPVKYKIFVDSGPVMEKDFAFNSGLGWIGKNSLFISPIYGSFCLIACLFTDLACQSEKPDATDLCGSCEACVKACPTQAIRADRTIDPGRCISYLTTFHKGLIPFEYQHAIGNHIFGCDICQSVCPLNHKLQKDDSRQENLLRPIIDNKINLLAELSISGKEYLFKYQNTPISKLTFELYRRNLIITSGNSGLKDFFAPLTDYLGNDPSPLLRTTAAYALKLLAPDMSLPILREAVQHETAAGVRQSIEKLPGISG